MPYGLAEENEEEAEAKSGSKIESICAKYLGSPHDPRGDLHASETQDIKVVAPESLAANVEFNVDIQVGKKEIVKSQVAQGLFIWESGFDCLFSSPVLVYEGSLEFQYWSLFCLRCLKCCFVLFFKTHHFLSNVYIGPVTLSYLCLGEF